MTISKDFLYYYGDCFRLFLQIGWQNYFNIMIFLLKYTYILICMWRNVRYNFFDFCLGSTAMCLLSRLIRIILNTIKQSDYNNSYQSRMPKSSLSMPLWKKLEWILRSRKSTKAHLFLLGIQGPLALNNRWTVLFGYS